MCGIAGYSRRVADKSSIKDGRRFAEDLALAIESRGPDAVGFGWHHPTTGEPWYWKAPGAAHKVVWEAPLPTGIKTLIAHTRWATKGSPSANVNNHPVIAPGIVLVHNGVVDNDDDLIAAVGHERLGRVDSEALAAILSLGGSVLGSTHPIDVLTEVEGDAAIAWLDSERPGVLCLARLVGRPLAVGWTRRGDLVFGSTPENLTLASKWSETTVDSVRTIAEGTYLEVVDGRIVDERRFTPRRRKYVTRTTYTTAGRSLPVGPVKPKSSTKSSKKQRRQERLGQRALALVESTQADTIDWSNLVPRRGWTDGDNLTKPFGRHLWSTAEQRWVPIPEGVE